MTLFFPSPLLFKLEVRGPASIYSHYSLLAVPLSGVMPVKITGIGAPGRSLGTDSVVYVFVFLCSIVRVSILKISRFRQIPSRSATEVRSVRCSVNIFRPSALVGGPEVFSSGLKPLLVGPATWKWSPFVSYLCSVSGRSQRIFSSLQEPLA
jgi:hypothetical protein